MLLLRAGIGLADLPGLRKELPDHLFVNLRDALLIPEVPANLLAHMLGFDRFRSRQLRCARLSDV